MLGGLAGQCADYIVGFKAGEFENRNAVGLERAPDVGDLLHQISRHFVAIGFVAVIFGFLKSLRFQIETCERW